MTDTNAVRRDDLYAMVWEKLRSIAQDAAPGSITPKTFAYVAVDVVMTELLRAVAIVPEYSDPRA